VKISAVIVLKVLGATAQNVGTLSDQVTRACAPLCQWNLSNLNRFGMSVTGLTTVHCCVRLIAQFLCTVCCDLLRTLQHHFFTFHEHSLVLDNFTITKTSECLLVEECNA
jgi:hypothetical protein